MPERSRGRASEALVEGGRSRSSGRNLDRAGRYSDWGRLSYTIVGVYLFLTVLVLVVLDRSTGVAVWTPAVVAGLFLFFLVRYLSTHYRIDGEELRAWKLLGGARVRLDQVRRIEYTALRDLSPTASFFGAWGWRGRLWSPAIGAFNSIYTDPARGLLVTAHPVPLYLSPRDPEAFARELSRRVRSYLGPLEADVGAPGEDTPAARA